MWQIDTGTFHFEPLATIFMYIIFQKNEFFLVWYLLDKKILGGNSNFFETFLAEILASPRFLRSLFSMVMFILRNSDIDSAVHLVFNPMTSLTRGKSLMRFLPKTP